MKHRRCSALRVAIALFVMLGAASASGFNCQECLYDECFPVVWDQGYANCWTSLACFSNPPYCVVVCRQTQVCGFDPPPV